MCMSKSKDDEHHVSDTKCPLQMKGCTSRTGLTISVVCQRVSLTDESGHVYMQRFLDIKSVSVRD